jgi:D-lactate dehydrogenase
MRVPAYSPYAVAEHTVALLLALNRKIHRAYNRVREGNFALEGLLGFDLRGKTVGIVGTGKIGQVFGDIMLGFGCQVLGLDPQPNPDFKGRYAEESELLRESHVLSLHCPLTPATHHWINPERLAQMRPGLILLNTGRGALVDTPAVITALKSGHLGALGLDVYEQESELFFEDLSNEIIQDDVFQRLLTFPNVLVTAHQAFFTQEALGNITDTTWSNLRAFLDGQSPPETTLLPRNQLESH